MSEAEIAIVGRLTAQDDYTHTIEDVPNFNESFLFHFAGLDDQGDLLGGLIRVANRPNERFAECTVLVWMPDGSALFNFERARISGNEGWSVSNWTMEVVKPGGRSFRTRYDGPAFEFSDPRILADPKQARTEPQVILKLDLSHFGKGPLTEFKHHLPMGTAEQRARERERYGTSALQQFMRFEGRMQISDRPSRSFKGFGWRDHSWGARNWQGFTDHVMLTANFDEREGICLFSTVDGCGYAFHRGGDQILEIEEADIDVDYRAGTREPIRLRASYLLSDGSRGKFSGRQRGYIPLRNRKNGYETSIGYSLWEYRHEDGRTCFGLGEFLEQREIKEERNGWPASGE